VGTIKEGTGGGTDSEGFFINILQKLNCTLGSTLI